MYSDDYTNCATLAGFLADARGRLATHHGDDLLLYLDELGRRAEGHDRYRELGVKQGISCAAVLLGNPRLRNVELVDISFSHLEPHKHLFTTFCHEHDIALDLRTISSISPDLHVSPCDLLFVDSFHYPDHVTAELEKHGPSVSKTIVLHDTAVKPSLHHAAVRWGRRGWRVAKRETRNVGFTVLEKN